MKNRRHGVTLRYGFTVSNKWHSGSFAKYSDIGLVTISFPACCVSHRGTGLPVMVRDMHTRRTRPDYLQACPTGPPVDGVKSALTPALCSPVALYLLQWPIPGTAAIRRRRESMKPQVEVKLMNHRPAADCARCRRLVVDLMHFVQLHRHNFWHSFQCGCCSIIALND